MKTLTVNTKTKTVTVTGKRIDNKVLVQIEKAGYQVKMVIK